MSVCYWIAVATILAVDTMLNPATTEVSVMSVFTLPTFGTSHAVVLVVDVDAAGPLGYFVTWSTLYLQALKVPAGTVTDSIPTKVVVPVCVPLPIACDGLKTMAKV